MTEEFMPNVVRHFICRSSENLFAVKFPIFDSGYWAIDFEDACQLVGGTLCLHESKNDPAYHGGNVLEVHLAGHDTPYPGRVVFRFEATREAKGMRWAGQSHAMAYDSGNVIVKSDSD